MENSTNYTTNVHSFMKGKEPSKREIFKVTEENGATGLLNEIVDQQISIIGYIVNGAFSTKDNKMKYRVFIFTDRDQVFVTGSSTVKYKLLNQIVASFGEALEWNEPLMVKVVKEKTENNHERLNIQLV